MDHGIIDRFNFWCTKVLPLVYDNSLSYYEVLCKLTKFIKELVLELDSWEEFNQAIRDDIEKLKKEWPEFQEMLEGEFNDFKNQTLQDIAKIEQDIADYEAALDQKQHDFEDKINDDFQELASNLNQGLDDFKNQIQDQQTEFEEKVTTEIDGMNQTLDDIKNGEYIDLYLDSIKKYIDENLQNFVAGLVKYVMFGLSHDGHFVAYIPDSWDFIEFSTITDPDSNLYNHLVLTW